jgi:hypothetical protein
MRQPAGKQFLVVIFAAALAACTSTKETVVDPNLFPSGFKKEILDTLTTTLSDPTNVRDASISDPALIKVANDQRYAVCLRFNPRDGNHHYMGITTRIAYFYAGHLNQLVDATKEQCGNATYKPFPELEKLCLGTKCL